MDQDPKQSPPYVFPKWIDRARPLLGLLLLGGPLYVIVLLYYGGNPKTTDVGYMPTQPVPYSHALHVGQLGMDCRYCHNTVEETGVAAIPPTATCMNCHSKVWAQSPKLEPVRDSFVTGNPVEWLKIHDLPDYAYFNHSAHVSRGVGCVSCHGRVDQMEEVYQHEPLSMSWCLDCHRHPEPNLRPPTEVTKMDWKAPGDPEAFGKELREKNNISPPTDCSTCHR